MNKTILIGRLCNEPEIRYSQGEKPVCIARYRLAVNRKYQMEGEQQADFIACVAFGKSGEFAEKYLHKGTKIAISGRIQTGSYINKDGQKVYTTDVVVEEHEFCEIKSFDGSGPSHSTYEQADSDGFINIPDGVENEGLPFN